jgi:hypothetical protein
MSMIFFGKPVSAPDRVEGKLFRIMLYSRCAASLQTSTHVAPVSCAMRSGEIRSALLREPAAGTTSSKTFSDTSQ